MPLSGIRQAAGHHCVVVADAGGDVMALALYEMRGAPPLEAGTTLELREPTLAKVEASAFWEEGDAAAPAGFHLLRVERPHLHLRVNGHKVKPPPRAPLPAARAPAK